MLDILRIIAISSAILLGGAALGPPTGETVLLPADAQTADAAAAAEELLLETLRRRANHPMIASNNDSEDTILVVTKGPDDVVCSWRQRAGSHFRERRCRSRFQAQREERQTAYALRRLRGS